MPWEQYLWEYFLKDLVAQLSSLPKKQLENVKAYFHDFTEHQVASGSAIEDIVSSLGSPGWMAQEILTDYRKAHPPAQSLLNIARSALNLLLLALAIWLGIMTIGPLLFGMLAAGTSPLLQILNSLQYTILMGRGGGILKMQIGGLVFFIGVLLLILTFVIGMFSIAITATKHLSRVLFGTLQKQSLAQHCQSIFRVQNPYLFCVLIFAAFLAMALGGYLMLSANQQGGYITPFMPTPYMPHL